MNQYQDEHKCGTCKKWFLITDLSQWVYKRPYKGRTKLFCSWTCMRAFDRKMEEQRKQAKHDKWLAKENANAE